CATLANFWDGFDYW
nr:immunoglobulin heavy chain junction region [Macaca mulatta]MOW84582.1 immunoglobulin heavy chain junction region [Macaca mulatta]MOW85938.1 immunoglobulin heavy chain junction region [Macaca mulatta]